MKHGDMDADGDARPIELPMVHTIAYLDDAEAFLHVKVNDHKKAWSKACFIALGVHRQKIKLADGVSVSETEKVHANVCPLARGELRRPGEVAGEAHHGSVVEEPERARRTHLRTQI